MSAPKNVYVQDPQAQLDYVWNWHDPAEGETVGWLAVGETISSFSILPPVPTGLVVGNASVGGPAPAQSVGKVTAWLSAGTAGVAYEIACHIVTSAGRIDERTIVLHIADQ